jgi:hypothetical protein
MKRAEISMWAIAEGGKWVQACPILAVDERYVTPAHYQEREEAWDRL